jgi:hypothetical protein
MTRRIIQGILIAPALVIGPVALIYVTVFFFSALTWPAIALFIYLVASCAFGLLGLVVTVATDPTRLAGGIRRIAVAGLIAAIQFDLIILVQHEWRMNASAVLRGWLWLGVLAVAVWNLGLLLRPRKARPTDRTA